MKPLLCYQDHCQSAIYLTPAYLRVTTGMRARDPITQHSYYVPSIVNRDPCEVDVRQILNYYQEIGNTNVQHHLSEQLFEDELSFLFGYTVSGFTDSNSQRGI